MVIHTIPHVSDQQLAMSHHHSTSLSTIRAEYLTEKRDVSMDTKLAVFLVMTCLFIQPLTAATIIEAVKTLFSLPTSSESGILRKAKAILFGQGMPYFAPPISDCSGGEEASMGHQGAREKVKEAAIKSFDKSKATVEDSARSAARLAEETVDKTVKKLKKTLSNKQRTEEDEL